MTSRECHDVSNHRQLERFLNSLIRLTSYRTKKFYVTCPLWAEPPVTCGFPWQRARNAENICWSWCYPRVYIKHIICSIVIIIIAIIKTSRSFCQRRWCIFLLHFSLFQPQGHLTMMASSNEKHFPRYWPFVRGIHRSPVNSPHKGQWRRALTFSLICAWINGWINNGEAGDLRRHRAHYDVSVM